MPNTVNDLLATVYDLLATVRDKEESMRSPLGGGVMAAIHAASRPAFIPQSAPPHVTSPAPVNYVTPPAPSITTAPKPDAMTLMANMLGQVLAKVNRLERNQSSHQNSRPNAFGGTRYGSTSDAQNEITGGSSDKTRNLAAEKVTAMFHPFSGWNSVAEVTLRLDRMIGL